MSKYYSISDDLNKFPEAFIIITFAGRATGKTYSGLKTVVEQGKKFCFIKRTLEDVKLLVAGNRLNTDNSKEERKFFVDVSPFKPLNRDLNWNIRAFNIYPGLGGFFKCDSSNNPVGEPIGYIMALSGAGKFKGFDMSEVDVIIFDEFVPVTGTRPLKDEGKILLDLYATISRDREQRGKKPLQLWCFANADNIVCPVIDTFGLIDELADMARKDREFHYDPQRKILLHKLKTSDDFARVERNKAIYTAMAGTKWAKMALENNFAFNDFSQVDRKRLKGMICEARVKYDNRYNYVYYDQATASRYICYSKCNVVPLLDLDLDRDSHKIKFVNYVELKIFNDIYNSEDAKFETYGLYDLYRNVRQRFN